MKKKDRYKGGIFLRAIGMKKNQSILDFGCRLANYKILAAVAAG